MLASGGCWSYWENPMMSYMEGPYDSALKLCFVFVIIITTIMGIEMFSGNRTLQDSFRGSMDVLG